jgi:hypothetical protein
VVIFTSILIYFIFFKKKTKSSKKITLLHEQSGQELFSGVAKATIFFFAL